MNQTGYQIEYVPCPKCKQHSVRLIKHYDKRLSDWIINDYPLCIECQERLKERK